MITLTNLLVLSPTCRIQVHAPWTQALLQQLDVKRNTYKHFYIFETKGPDSVSFAQQFQLCFWSQCPSMAANLRSYQREIILTKGDQRGRAALMIGFFFRFLTTGHATTLFSYLGPCLLILYIRNFIHPIPYNRKMLSSNKEQLCRDPVWRFHTSSIHCNRCFLHPVYTVLCFETPCKIIGMRGSFPMAQESESCMIEMREVDRDERSVCW